MNPDNSECKVLNLNDCRDTNAASYICLTIIDGWCKDKTSNSCVKSIQTNYCKERSTNYCKNILTE